MIYRSRLLLVVGTALLFVVTPCLADFNWGNCGSNGGSGSFNQPVAYNAILDVGEIIAGLRDVKINLRSVTDIDVQLYDKTNGRALVKWPTGDLNGPGVQSLTYQGLTITWSGYNGDGTGLGNEYIHITGTTNRSYMMKVYGFQSGTAEVTYTWAGGGNNSGNCDGGTGTFQQQINHNATVTVGEIPSGLQDVYIALSSTNDVDVQLIDKSTGTEIVAWPNGLMSGEGTQTRSYQGMTVVWSGYNGDQVDGRYGYEFIAVHGKVTRTLVMKAYGFNAGFAKVDYSWGKRFIIYSAIHGGGSSDLTDWSGITAPQADGCTELRDAVKQYSGGNRNWNPDSDAELELIAGAPLGGMYAVAFRIACGSQFQGNSRATVYYPHNSTFVRQRLEKYYNDQQKRARVYLAGFSVGGGDVQNLEFKLKELGIPVQLAVHIDSVDIGDARIPSNVTRAMGFYQKDSLIGHGEDALYAVDSTETFVTNTQVTLPIGDSKGIGPDLLNYQHRNMDNDPRTWKPFLQYLDLHR